MKDGHSMGDILSCLSKHQFKQNSDLEGFGEVGSEYMESIDRAREIDENKLLLPLNFDW